MAIALNAYMYNDIAIRKLDRVRLAGQKILCHVFNMTAEGSSAVGTQHVTFYMISAVIVMKFASYVKDGTVGQNARTVRRGDGYYDGIGVGNAAVVAYYKSRTKLRPRQDILFCKGCLPGTFSGS